MTIRLAFAGFRHGHILSLYNLASQRQDVAVVAAAEEHAPTRDRLQSEGKVHITHSSYDHLFSHVEFDALAVGDYYGRRGEILIRALEASKHVIADKPICTRLGELERIAELARDRGLSVGCMLTMRDSANFLTLRSLVSTGRIGEVHTVCFCGQHPLLRGTRPTWYFEPGKQGGTINDLAIHAVDAIGWLTGRRIVAIVAARTWNGNLTQPDWFQVGAQLMLRLDHGGGAIGDVSYLAPDACGYAVNSYWRFTLHAGRGQAETAATDKAVTVYTHDGQTAERIPPGPPRPGGYFDSFLAELAGRREGLSPSTSDVLASSRIALLAQRAADENLRDLPV